MDRSGDSLVATSSSLLPELGDLCAEYEIAGAVVGVSIGGERAVAVHGVTSTATGAPVTRATAFQLGSVTKAVTASMVALLVAEGRVGLDDPVVAHVPEFRVGDPAASRSITVRHLLSHTAGFDGDVWPDHGDDDSALVRLVDGIGDLGQLSAPGEAFSYNNVGFAVLGRLVEAVRGTTYAAALAEMIAGPAAARLTLGLEGLGTGDHAVGHERGEAGWVPVAEIEGPGSLAPAGSRTWAPMDDLLSFGEVHLGRRAPHLHDALLAMREPEIEVLDPNNGGVMALGVFLDDRWGSPVVFHDGGIAGQAAYLRVLPERDAVLAVVASGGVPQVFHRHVFRALSRALLDLTSPLGAVVDPRIRVDPARVVGTYGAAASAAEIRHTDAGLESRFTWGYGDDAVTTDWLPTGAATDRALLAPFGGRDLVIVLPPNDRPCDHVLHGLRRVNRRT